MVDELDKERFRRFAAGLQNQIDEHLANKSENAE